MNIVDTHAHLFLEEFTHDLPQVIQRARNAGVTRIFMPAIDSTTLKPLLEVCDAYPDYCFPMIGLHPTSVTDTFRQELAIVEAELDAARRYVAVGEIGMDLYWDKTYLKEQQQALEMQINLALQYNLPVVLHCREAFTYIYKVLEPYRHTALRGIFHSFTGTIEDAAYIMQYPGFLFGINGVVTFKKSTLPEVLETIPLERIVLETDSPYLTPMPHRGKRNESAHVRDVLYKVAEIYQTSPDKVAERTSTTALEVFGKLR
ncbi:MAG: TatD family hydrolase [Prevotellaceae bacterium]|jgi:TatD DNase family protein|nr:TatD family hydrolase [Prevotellaceae bacterium]